MRWLVGVLLLLSVGAAQPPAEPGVAKPAMALQGVTNVLLPVNSFSWSSEDCEFPPPATLRCYVAPGDVMTVGREITTQMIAAGYELGDETVAEWTDGSPMLLHAWFKYEPVITSYNLIYRQMTDGWVLIHAGGL